MQRAGTTVPGLGMDVLSVPGGDDDVVAPNDAFQVRIGVGVGRDGDDDRGEQVIRVGGGATATVVNNNATVAQLVTQALTGKKRDGGDRGGRDPDAAARWRAGDGVRPARPGRRW